jgi:hypothetical protein
MENIEGVATDPYDDYLSHLNESITWYDHSSYCYESSSKTF